MGTPAVDVRRVTPADAAEWVRMRTALWPEAPGDHPVEIRDFFDRPPARADCLIALRGGRAVGFAEVALRDYAEACPTSPVGYLEGIWVESEARREGVGLALVRAAEAWARAQGCSEMASDRALDNERSGAFHVAAGFDEVDRIVCYRKSLLP